MKKTKLGKLLDKWRYTLEYDTTHSFPRDKVERCLYQAWKVTPSKNSFMPYKVFVIGPENWDIKYKIHKIALMKEFTVNERNYNPNKWPDPIMKRCLKNAEYTIVFCPRVEDKPSKWQKHLHEGGCFMDAWYEDMDEKYKKNILLEVGMFAANLTVFCLEQGIATNYISSFESRLEYWKDIDFVKTKPCLLMTLGKTLRTRRQWIDKEERKSNWDVKPDYDRVVKFISN